MDYVRTDFAPAPSGPYEQAIICNGAVYVSMQLPVSVGEEESFPNIEEQTALILNNVKAILEASGSSLDKTLRIRIYLKDVGTLKRINGVYEQFFPTHRPARSVIGVTALPMGFGIAMEVTAAAGP